MVVVFISDLGLFHRLKQAVHVKKRMFHNLILKPGLQFPEF